MVAALLLIPDSIEDQLQELTGFAIRLANTSEDGLLLFLFRICGFLRRAASGLALGNQSPPHPSHLLDFVFQRLVSAELRVDVIGLKSRTGNLGNPFQAFYYIW